MMQQTSELYREAIVASHRKIAPSAIIYLVSPDIAYGTIDSSGVVWYSDPKQLHDKEFAVNARHASLEQNYWLLDGTFELPPDGLSEAQTGLVLGDLCDEAGYFRTPVFVQQNLTGVKILQVATIQFSELPMDGFATDFLFEVISGGTVVFAKQISGNTRTSLYVEGFTAYDVTALRATFQRWSIPYRRVRVAELVPGLYEAWDGKQIFSVDVVQETAFDCMTTPYGVCTLSVHNENKRFNPYSKNSIFKSIEERQGIPVFYSLRLPSGVMERIPVGVYFQQDGGWETSAYGATMTFRLVDIVGLVTKRLFQGGDMVPTTLDGWVAAIVAHLGVNFLEEYIVDDRIAGAVLTAEPEAVQGMECGKLLRMLCMAVGAYFCADSATGRLKVALLEDTVGQPITLDNMHAYPQISANNEVADITFQLANEKYTVIGTLTASGKSLAVDNPFIKTQDDANRIARNIITHYGGSRIVVRGRGDMSAELADISAIETGFGQEVSARRYMQELRISDGVMTNVMSRHIQSTGVSQYTDRVVLTGGGMWAAPPGVREIKIVLVSGGDGGARGTDGTWDENGRGGAGGAGGKVFSAVIEVNSGQNFSVGIGAGGTVGTPGGRTTFGLYSSDNGARYSGWGDISTGDVFGLSGRDGNGGASGMWRGQDGAAGSGNGGGGGDGGARGVRGLDPLTGNWVIKRYPAAGSDGGSGGSGCVIIYYDRGSDSV